MTEKWSYRGDWITSCNCDWGCPCNFNAMPSKGHCEGALGLKIKEGSYGKTRLNGIKVAAAVWWPGAIYQGNGVLQAYIDDKTSKQQETALLDILTGKAGGNPWPILAKTFSTVLPPKRAPIDMEVKGKDTILKVGKQVNVAAEPMRNPVTKEEAYADVVMHQYLVFNKGSLFSNKVHTVNEPAHPKLEWSHPGQYIAVADVKHQGP